MGRGQFLSDLACETEWTGMHAYSLSKLANAMLAVETAERYGDAPRLTFHTINPGPADTKLARQGASWGRGPRKGRGKGPKRGGQYELLMGLLPSVRAATAPFRALTEVSDAAKRAALWEEAAELTGAVWPEIET